MARVRASGCRGQGTVGGDIWYEPGEAGRVAVMTDAESADGDYGLPGELSKVTEPKGLEGGAGCTYGCTLIVGKYFCWDVASRNVIGDALSARGGRYA